MMTRVAAWGLCCATVAAGAAGLTRRGSFLSTLAVAVDARGADARGAYDRAREAAVSAPCDDGPLCVSSSDDAARGSRSFAEPWTYDGTLAAARKRLADVLVAEGLNLAADEATYLCAVDGGDVYEFFFPDDDARVAFRADRPYAGGGGGGGLTFGQSALARRLERVRVRCGFEAIPVLRNRRRSLGFVESPFDSFGPSFFDAAADLTGPDTLKDNLDPLAPTWTPPDAATRRWLKQAREAQSAQRRP